jgi:hypothetical protein
VGTMTQNWWVEEASSRAVCMNYELVGNLESPEDAEIRGDLSQKKTNKELKYAYLLAISQCH